VREAKYQELKIQGAYAIVTHMTNPSHTTSVLSVRVNPDERAILEAAAEQAHTSLSEFIRRKALESAEAEVLNRTIVTIPAKDWEAFEAWINRPAETIPALAELGRLTPSWEK
jgi:uncharacterized protein (DUF1778 family)